jgi:DNA polymerase III subunit delta'
MTFDQLVGQQDAKARLVRTLQDGRAHAFLITGPDGSGKSTLARTFAQFALCDAPTDRGACGRCNPCVLFGAGTNPDYRLLEILKREKEKNLKVERVRRELSADVDMRPQFSRRKVYVVEADDLNEQGQNALLKTLEEPPPSVVIVLVARTAASLLPTVLSRVCHVRLHPSTETEMRAILAAAGVTGDERVSFLSRYAQGIPGVALSLAHSEDFIRLREGVFALLDRLGTSTRGALLTDGFAFFNESGNKKEVDDLLELLASAVRDLLVLSTAKDPALLIHVDKKDIMERIRPKGSDAARRCQNAANAVDAARRGLDANANYETTICQLLLQLRKEFSHA